MIDTHCHLLAGLDDGPRSFNDSLRMARRLSETGVRIVVGTPHFNHRYPTPVGAAAAARDRLADAVSALGLPLEVRLAAELSVAMALSAPADDIHHRRLAAGHVLVELEPATTAAELRNLEARLETLGLRAVLGHPERCRMVERHPEVLDGPRSRGALVQIVSPSLDGEAKSQIGRAAWSLLESGRVDLVASDAHRPDSSRLQLGAISAMVAARFGDDVAEELFARAPARLLGVSAPSNGYH